MTAQLAAWTVTNQADGGIRVTIRELRDPAGLQRTLRADGVPASVTFLGHPNPACHRYAGAGFKHSQAGRSGSIALTIGLVQASPGCTGS